MGSLKLSLSYMVIMGVILFSPLFVYADAGDTALDWVNSQVRSFSERHCRATIDEVMNKVFLKLHNQIYETAQQIRELRAELISIQEEIVHLSLDRPAKDVNMMQLLETQRAILKLYDRMYVSYQKILFNEQRFDKVRADFTALANRQALARMAKRPVLEASFIEDVDEMDGINMGYSSNLPEAAYQFLKGIITSARNIRKNRKINKKIREARESFVRLQVSQPEYDDMMWQAFQLRLGPYEEMIEKTQASLLEVVVYGETARKRILERFAYLDKLRTAVIVNRRVEEFHERLYFFKKKWHLQEAELFKLDAELKLKFLTLLQTSARGMVSEQLAHKIRTLEQNLRIYLDILGAMP